MRKIMSILFLILAIALVSSQAALAGSELQQGGKAYYVAWGDSLDSIAARHGVSVEAILRQNGLSNPDLIYVGQLLIIPTSGYGNTPGYDHGYSSCGTYHIVQAGETLSGIAWAYNTTVYALLENNNLYNKDFVYVGQKLCIPGSGYHDPYPQHDNNDWGYSQPRPQSQYHHHTVAPGETLSAIALLYGVNQWSIVEANHMSNASYIWTGQALVIPVSASWGAKPDYSYGHDGAYKPVPKYKYQDGYKPDYKKDGHHDYDKKSQAPDVYVRLGRNVNYEEWGRPQLGLDDCSNWFDDAQIVRRMTVEVIVTNKSSRELSGDWASSGNVVFHTAAGATRYACKHIYASDSPALTEQGHALASQNPDVYPKPLAPGGTINVTFYTHLEKGDFATKIEFRKFDACFDPNSGDRILCD